MNLNIPTELFAFPDLETGSKNGLADTLPYLPNFPQSLSGALGMGEGKGVPLGTGHVLRWKRGGGYFQSKVARTVLYATHRVYGTVHLAHDHTTKIALSSGRQLKDSLVRWVWRAQKNHRSRNTCFLFGYVFKLEVVPVASQGLAEKCRFPIQMQENLDKYRIIIGNYRNMFFFFFSDPFLLIIN